MCYNRAMEERKILLRLFVSTLYLSAFTFGGGYVIVTLMKKKFVDEYHWIKEEEMLDLLIFVLCLLLLKKARMNPIWVMLLAGAANVALSLAGL